MSFMRPGRRQRCSRAWPQTACRSVCTQFYVSYTILTSLQNFAPQLFSRPFRDGVFTYHPLGDLQLRLGAALGSDTVLLLERAADNAGSDGEVAVVTAAIQVSNSILIVPIFS